MNKKFAVMMITAAACILAVNPAYAAKNNGRTDYKQVRVESNAQLKSMNEEIKGLRAEIKGYSEKLKAFNTAKKNGETTLDKETLQQIRQLRLELKEIRGKHTKPAAQVTEAEVSVEESLEIDAQELLEIVAADVSDEEGPETVDTADAAAVTDEETVKAANEIKQLRTKAREAASAGNYEDAKKHLGDAVSKKTQKLEQMKRIRDKWKEIIALLPASYR